jgi:hypothetical protein
MKSSSDSMLAVVDAGVPSTPFFRLGKLAELARSVFSDVDVAESALRERCRSEVAAFACPWAAFGRDSLSKAASAAFLFRVLGGVMK